MYIHPAPAARSAAEELCPSSYPLCAPSLSAGPALPDINDTESSPADSTTLSPGAVTTSYTQPDGAQDAQLEPQPEAALAGTIQHLGGRRNLVGIVVLAVFVFVGLVLWLSFGRWPRAGVRRLRARLARGDKRAKSLAAKTGDGAGGAVCGEDVEPLPDPGQLAAVGRDREAPGGSEARGRDEKLGGDEAAPPCSPLPAEIEVDVLEKDAGDAPERRGLHVHFA